MPHHQAHLIGIAGLIGAGKSAVADIVRAAGFPVINADDEAHVLYRDNGEVRTALAKAFGPDILTAEGVDRPRLGALVFSHSGAMQTLEGIIHPVLALHLHRLLRSEAETHAKVFLEGALLPRWQDLLGEMDEVWEVVAPLSARLQRVMARGLSQVDARARMQRQADLPPIRHARMVILQNDRDLSALDAQVKRLLA